MDWIWSKVSSKKDDPVSKLDPGLKEFLKEQQPAKYETAPRPAPAPIESQKAEVKLPDTNAVYEDRPLPKESLFQDGRYAHLWKTYTPQSVIDQADVNPTKRIHDAYKDRRHLIHSAALENCALENEALNDCFKTGDWKQKAYARATLCRTEDKAFNRCYQLQAKFLLALGYMAPDTSTSPEQDERVQMHADKLYHRMLDYEAAVEEARENDDPIPELRSIFDHSRPAPDPTTLKIPSGVERKMKSKLSELSPHEKELAVTAWRTELKSNRGYAKELTQYMEEQYENKKQRQETLSRIFGDSVAKFLVEDTEKPYIGNEPPPPTHSK